MSSERLMIKPNAKLFAGNGCPQLAQDIATEMGTKLSKAKVSRFCDGEIAVEIHECVRGCDVFVVQSTCPPVNDNLMELMLMMDAFKRASARRIFVVMPYYGYARQDRKAAPRDPIAAKLIANMLTIGGANGVLTMDLHAKQIQGFFDIPVDHLMGVPILAEHYIERGFKGSDIVVVSPDLGSVARARSFAKRLDAPLAIIDKRRPKANQSEVMNIIGDVKGKRTIVIDDLIDTGGTFINGATALVEEGATEVYACATHGVLSLDCIARLEKSPIKELIITDTVPLAEEKQNDIIKILSAAPAFAQGIASICQDQTMDYCAEESGEV